MIILVLNAGSSTLKFSLIESVGENVLAEGTVDWSANPARFVLRRPGQPEVRSELAVQQHDDAVQQVVRALGDASSIAAVGHRVVHGGSVYVQSVAIDATVKGAIGKLAELAPLHNPASLRGIEAAEAALPGVPQVAAFDTAFQVTMEEAVRVYPVPYSWYREWGLQRFGFHGLSHAYCAGRAAQLLNRPTIPRLVVCHLGNGCSVSAIREGKCVDISMGFTPLEGLMMGTRSGSVDPGLLLHVLRRKGVTPDELDTILNHESGLLGISGVSADMREVLAAVDKGHVRARLAVEIFCHRVRQTIGAMTATLGGIDALVFTAGVGENAAPIRQRCCTGLEYLGLELDPPANAHAQPDADVATGSSRGRILVIGTREEVMIAREVIRLTGP